MRHETEFDMSYIRKKRKKRSLLKRIFKPKYRFVRKEYYSNINVISYISDLAHVLKYNYGIVIEIENRIDFRNIQFGKPKEKIFEVMGSPRFEIDNSKHIKGHNILFYKEKVGGFSLKIQIHFINNKFFYVNYLFNSDRISQSFKDEIINIITNKYDHNNQHLGNHTLIDPMGNKLAIRDDINFNISFISGGKYFSGLLEKQTITKKAVEKTTEYESLKKLF